jgi:hypothetical protein
VQLFANCEIVPACYFGYFSHECVHINDTVKTITDNSCCEFCQESAHIRGRASSTYSAKEINTVFEEGKEVQQKSK